jgi:hypothetical protein
LFGGESGTSSSVSSRVVVSAAPFAGAFPPFPPAAGTSAPSMISLMLGLLSETEVVSH